MDETRKKKIPSEVTQTQKGKHGMYSFISGILDVKQRITRLQPTVPEKRGNKEGPKTGMDHPRK